MEIINYSNAMQKIFCIVVSRTKKDTEEKISELSNLKIPFIIICGEKSQSHLIAYRKAKGKFDAINFSSNFFPKNAEFIVFNDVDTKIFNFEKMIEPFKDPKVALVFCKVKVRTGPQTYFYSILDRLRNKFHVVSSGELMCVRKNLLEKILPLPPCKAEDSLISFKLLEMGYKIVFSKECWVQTSRTINLVQETSYKKRTVTGIYQALQYSKPPIMTRLFFLLLPFFSPILLIQGRRGFCWFKGIITGYVNYLRGDREGKF